GGPRFAARAARRSRVRSRMRRAAGFTLVELLLVVALLATLSLLTLPKASHYLSRSRGRQSAYTLLRVLRQARSMALRDGVAFYLHFDANLANNHGMLFRYRGMTNRCHRVDWVQAWGSGGANPPDGHGNAGEYLDMLPFNRNSPSQVVSIADTDRHVIQMDAYLGATLMPSLNICYEPSGRVLTSNNPSTPGVLTRQRQIIKFDVRQTLGGAAQGGPRRVIVEPGAQPRIHHGAL
ncbi:MAG: prepilin-type N-terminal cleavage/methylation domain-containing protein, partial [Myxococcales bacterium]|nr:prepilin-type N-terminal cleavage/methylation domain-containing protein [Myxococcales bacterium]